MDFIAWNMVVYNINNLSRQINVLHSENNISVLFQTMVKTILFFSYVYRRTVKSTFVNTPT